MIYLDIEAIWKAFIHSYFLVYLTTLAIGIIVGIVGRLLIYWLWR